MWVDACHKIASDKAENNRNQQGGTRHAVVLLVMQMSLSFRESFFPVRIWCGVNPKGLHMSSLRSFLKSIKKRLRSIRRALVRSRMLQGRRQNPTADRASMFSVIDENNLDAVCRYLLNEVSELRTLTRHLLAESPRYRQFIQETGSSFNYQWGNIEKGTALRGDPEFLRQCRKYVSEYTGLPESWFAGKSVLDAGSGNGRWAATFCELGANVTAFDFSENGVADTKRECAGHDANVFRHNVLEPIPVDKQFDLVWSYGVLHHT